MKWFRRIGMGFSLAIVATLFGLTIYAYIPSGDMTQKSVALNPNSNQVVLAASELNSDLTIENGLYTPATYTGYQDITITDTSGVTRTNFSVLTGISGANLVSVGYISASGLDTNLQDGSTNLPYMMDTVQLPIFLNTLNAYQSRVVRLYYGYSPMQTGFPVITGLSGYITTPDAAGIELGNNFTLEINGYIRCASPCYILGKTSAIVIFFPTDGTIRVVIPGASNLSVTGQTTGLHDYILSLSGGT